MRHSAIAAPPTRGRSTGAAWRGWAEWSALNMDTPPCQRIRSPSPPTLPSGLTDGAAAATVRTIRAAIRAGHVDTGADDPTGHDGVRRVLQGLTRQAAGRGRGQADPLTADDVAAIMATASIPRRTGRGMESEAAAADRGATDRAIVAVLFQGGLRRSEAAALRWADVQDAADGRGIVVYVRRSKTDQDGTAADVRYLKNGCAAALRQLRDRLTVQRSGLRPDGTAQVLGGINGQSIARRLTAAASAAGIEGRITGHSGRVGLAVELTRRGAPEQATAKAGGWKSSTDGRPLRGGRRSRAGRRRYLPVAGAAPALRGPPDQCRRTSAARHPATPPGAADTAYGGHPVSAAVKLPRFAPGSHVEAKAVQRTGHRIPRPRRARQRSPKKKSGWSPPASGGRPPSTNLLGPGSNCYAGASRTPPGHRR